MSESDADIAKDNPEVEEEVLEGTDEEEDDEEEISEVTDEEDEK